MSALQSPGSAQRSRWIGWVVLAIALGNVLDASAQVRGPSPIAAVDGELLVGFRGTMEAQAVAALLDRVGARFVEEVGPTIARVRAAPPALDAVARALAQRAEVAFVERNAVLATALVPDDPQRGSQWHLARIGLPQAWELTQGSTAVVIAIVDSGVDPHHPDLAGKLVAGFNAVDGSTRSADQFGHGTKMAGIAGARTGNGVGIAGVAGRSPIMPVRVTDRSGRATSAAIAKGIAWAADHGARVVNLSLEGVTRSAAIRAASEYAFRHGALVVAPSGNCGCIEPAQDTPFILSVAATDEDDRIAPLSATGGFVDLSAPGVNLPTTAMYGLYLGESGTSLASAVVAGVAALMFSVNPALTPAEATQLLEQTAVDRDGAARARGAGHGRVDAFAAVRAAAGRRAPGAADGVTGEPRP